MRAARRASGLPQHVAGAQMPASASRWRLDPLAKALAEWNACAL